MGMVYGCVCTDRDKQKLESTFDENCSPKHIGKFKQVSTPLSKDPLATYSDGHALESNFKRNLEEQEDYVAMMQQY
jgi:hypothetical protein